MLYELKRLKGKECSENTRVSNVKHFHDKTQVYNKTRNTKENFNFNETEIETKQWHLQLQNFYIYKRYNVNREQTKSTKEHAF